MPFVVPMPLAGVASPLLSLDGRISDLEAHRLGATVATEASFLVPVGVSTGGPTATVAIASGGSALIACGMLLPASNFAVALLGLTVNGTQVVSTEEIAGTNSNPVPVSIVWAVNGLPLGLNTFGMAFDCISNAFTATSLYVSVVPT